MCIQCDDEGPLFRLRGYETRPELEFARSFRGYEKSENSCRYRYVFRVNCKRHTDVKRERERERDGRKSHRVWRNEGAYIEDNNHNNLVKRYKDISR